ncbi:MAG: hypothetical protein ACT4OO_12870 [Nitrospiraceae bacterium]
MKTRVWIAGLAFVMGLGVINLAAAEPGPTDPMSSSKSPDRGTQTGNSTFDAPDKNPGPHGEIPGGGGPSGTSDGIGQKAPQFEGEKHKSPEQSARDAQSKPGGRDAHR